MKIFITGITGSLGSEVTRQLLKKSDTVQIFGYSRDEHRQKSFLKDDRITLILGDIRDRDRVIESTRGMDIIFHFAALKHVDLLEENPEESIRTNVNGTENILHAQRVNKIPKVVLSSTDKAVEPMNVYGCCKAIAEKLVLRNKNNAVCRYGNVLASNGSVLPIFVNAIKSGKKVPITHYDMTRFFITLPEAAKFVIESGFSKTGLCIPDMKSTGITGLLGALSIAMEAPSLLTENIGIRPGEKLHEVLRIDSEGGLIRSDKAQRFTNDELVKMLKPILESA